MAAKKFVVFALAAAALFVAGCSSTRLAYLSVGLAYSNLTPMAVWWVDDYVDLRGEQRDWVRARIDAAHAWHRSQELPEYRRWLESILDHSEDGISADEAREAYVEMRSRYHRFLAHMAPDIAEFLLQLDAAQVKQLERKFSDDERKMVKDSVKGTAEERQARRVRTFLEHIEEWTGKLSAAQRDLVAGHVRAIPELFEERLAERRYRQGETIALLQAQPSHAEMTAAMTRLLVETDSWRRPDYAARQRSRERQYFEMIAALSATLDAGQRSHFRARVRGYVGDISELIAAS
jgi:hypothetical protein